MTGKAYVGGKTGERRKRGEREEGEGKMWRGKEGKREKGKERKKGKGRGERNLQTGG